VPALPPDLVDRARAFARGSGKVAETRDAATVVLLRDGLDGVGLEVYLLRRAPSMAFAAGMYVFPGGSVDSRDVGQVTGWAGPAPTEWARRLGCDEGLARALVCAAVRETFEESGILLAGASPGEVVADTTGAEWEADRLALIDRTLSFAEMLRRRELVLRSDLLRVWAHWITPEFEPRRFDTRFFVAAVPDGQRTRDVGGEADRVVWLPVPEAVAGYQAGKLPMLPPTAVTLRELSTYDALASVLAADRDVSPLMPRAVVEGDDVRLVLDGAGGEQPADGMPT
jgi:8-oxo-dGTP pyrophosphatase MutT (NUDIX family)